MQDKHLFEYAVIRVVPKVEREEFLNVGVILYCQKQKFLQVMFNIDEQRLCAFAKDVDCEELKAHFQSIERICLGDKSGGPIAALDMASRFRWLTATRSTVVQPSKVHPGFCSDAAETLTKLYSELVL
jgi:hypothetical protein